MTCSEKEPSMRVLLANPAFTRDLGDGLERYMLGAGMRYLCLPIITSVLAHLAASATSFCRITNSSQ
jgi:hypothetical protein